MTAYTAHHYIVGLYFVEDGKAYGYGTIASCPDTEGSDGKRMAELIATKITPTQAMKVLRDRGPNGDERGSMHLLVSRRTQHADQHDHPFDPKTQQSIERANKYA